MKIIILKFTASLAETFISNLKYVVSVELYFYTFTINFKIYLNNSCFNYQTTKYKSSRQLDTQNLNVTLSTRLQNNKPFFL